MPKPFFVHALTALLFLLPAYTHADFLGNLVSKLTQTSPTTPLSPSTPPHTPQTPLNTQNDPTQAQTATALKRPAHIRILDKRTNRLTNHTLNNTAPLRFDDLSIQVKNCLRHHHQVGHHAAWMTITEESPKDPSQKDPQTEATQQSTPRFSGWMLSAFPAVSALEHPRYDIRLVECKR